MIAFFSYLSSNLHEAFINCNDFNSMIDVCVDVCEMYSAIKITHNKNQCDVPGCQVKSVIV